MYPAKPGQSLNASTPSKWNIPEPRTAQARGRLKRRATSGLVALGVLCLWCTAASAAETRLYALVIGNGKYPQGELKNPANDARLVAKTLERLNFDVTLKLDQSHRDMDVSIAEFSRRVPKNGLAFFFFAGHGLQIHGENYLIPIDAQIENEAAVRYKTVPQNQVLDTLSLSPSNMNVVVLDCCRDNPFQRAWSRSIKQRGLAPVAAIPEGTLIAYATAPGATASDGDGTNSPYTIELVKALSKAPTTGLLLRDVFFDASAAVRKSTGQRPWLNLDASLDRFYIRPPSELSDAKGAIEVPDILSTEIDTSDPTQSVSLKSQSSPAPDLLQPKPPLSIQIDKTPIDDSLLQQANSYLYEGKYDLAIDAFSALLSNPDADAELQQQARMSRGVAYLGRRGEDDVERAIIDYKAAGKNGVQMTVLADSADLKVGKNTRGTARRNQIALVTLSKGKWLWVASVQGNESMQGWIAKTAFLKEKPKPEPEPAQPTRPAVVTNPSPQTSQSASSGFSSGATNTNSRNGFNNGFSSGQSVPFNQGRTSNQGQMSNRTQMSNQGRTNSSFQPNRSMSNQTWNSGNNNQRNHSQSSRSGNRAPAGATPWVKRYFEKHGRAPSHWETPQWESFDQIREGKAKGWFR